MDLIFNNHIVKVINRDSERFLLNYASKNVKLCKTRQRPRSSCK